MKLFLKRVLLFIVFFLFLMGCILAAVYLKRVGDYKKAVEETTFGGVELSDIADGIYVGEYDVDFIYAKVEVRVQGGAILS